MAKNRNHVFEGELIAAIMFKVLEDADPQLVAEAISERPDANKLIQLLVQHNTQRLTALRDGGGKAPQQPAPAPASARTRTNGNAPQLPVREAANLFRMRG